MDKILLQFYGWLILTFLSCFFLIPNLFYHTNNTINYLLIKTLITINNKKPKTVEIYQHKGNLIIMMDDGWQSQYVVGYQYMRKKGLRGSIAVITNYIDQPNYLTLGNLLQLYHDDWDILNHTHNHTNLAKYDYDKQKKDIEKAYHWLNKRGFNNGNILIFPHGQYNNQTIKIMDKLNIISGRGITDGFNDKYIDDFYQIRIKNVLSNTKPEAVFTWIEQTIAENLTLILLFHKLEKITDHTLMQYDIQNFQKIIDYIAEQKQNLNIITFSDWIYINKYLNY